MTSIVRTGTGLSADALTGAFAGHFGQHPDGVWQAPGRVNLIGEHTDYNEGLVLPFAIDRSTTVAVAARADRTVGSPPVPGRDRSEVDLDTFTPDQAAGWSAYPAGVAWELEHAGITVPGFDLFVSSDVPVGAGLSSSAALECAVALALSDLTGGRPGPRRTGGHRTACREQHGRRPHRHHGPVRLDVRHQGLAVFLDCRDLSSRPVPLGLDASRAGLPGH